MITVIKTVHGSYNVFGTRTDAFCLEGNLTLEELKLLKKEVDREVKKAARV